jgi:hypothetical protein
MRARCFHRRDDTKRTTPRCWRCSGCRRRGARGSEDRHIAGLERQRRLLAPLRSNPAIDREMLDALLAEIDDVSARMLALTGKSAPICAKTMADGDQAAHGDPRRRLRVRPARLPLLAAPGAAAAPARPAKLDRRSYRSTAA